MCSLRTRLLIACSVFLTTAPVITSAATCESLQSLMLPDTTITLSEPVAAGAFAVSGTQQGNAFADLPAFCRVAATLSPTSDSEINLEVWLPATNWNGKYQAVGNGGWAGAINYADMADALRRGYAASSTDTGHTGDGGAFALGHPEKLIDFGYRAIHEMTVSAKAIITAFYETASRFSYFNGCSTGGRQALIEAQRFPDDYDGIIAGHPANPRPRLSAWQLFVAKAVLIDPASYIPPDQYPLIHQAVMGACDAIDGLEDGLIDNPEACTFDPQVLQCEAGASPDAACLTPPQVESARLMTNGPKDPRTGAEVFPALSHGVEMSWGTIAGGPEPRGNAHDHFKYVVFADPNWDWRTFNFETDLPLAEKIDGGLLNATDPNLQSFIDRGGKLLMYHGWNDQNIPPRATINYYNSVVETMGYATTSPAVRLFMAPGMAHCGGGPGPNTFDAVTALEQWVEAGVAPDQIIAAHRTGGSVDRTRPLCPYPQVARYTGSGSIDEAANFACQSP